MCALRIKSIAKSIICAVFIGLVTPVYAQETEIIELYERIFSDDWAFHDFKAKISTEDNEISIKFLFQNEGEPDYSQFPYLAVCELMLLQAPAQVTERTEVSRFSEISIGAGYQETGDADSMVQGFFFQTKGFLNKDGRCQPIYPEADGTDGQAFFEILRLIYGLKQLSQDQK